MRHRFFLLIFIFGFFLITVSNGQPTKTGLVPDKPLSQFLIENWSSQDGLPSNALTNVTITKDGFLWVSGYNGISRFDGYQFITYNKSNLPILNSNTIYSLFEDNSNQKWICTNGSGVLKYSQGKFINPFSDQYVPKTIRRGLADNNIIWLGSDGEGLYKLENGLVSQVKFPDVMDVTILDIKRDQQGAIWVCTDGKGVTKITGGIFTSYRAISGGAHGRFRSLHVDSHGTTWIGSYEGLYYLKGGKILPVGILKGNPINYITEDIYGNLWVASNNGIVRRNALTDEFEFLDESTGLPGTEFSSVFIDNSNDLWFTSSRDGLFRMRSGSFVNYGKAQGISSNKVNTLLETGDDAVLVGTEDGKLYTIDHGKVNEFNINYNFPKTRIRNIYKDSEGVLWISSYFGLFRKDGANEKLYTTDDGLPTNQIRFVKETYDGNLLIGTLNAGLIKWDKKNSFEAYDVNKGLRSNFITSLAIDENNGLIVGSNGGGLSLIDPLGNITTYGVEEGVSNRVIFSIFIDGQDTWFASSAGLGMLNDSKIYAKNSIDGLPTESFFDVIEGDDKKFWVTSAFGIYTFDKSELRSFMMDQSEEIGFELFTENDGLSTKECIGAVHSLKISNGKMWFPTMNGLAVVDPKDIVESNVVPDIYLDEFLVNDKKVELTEDVKISSGKNRLTFEYTAPEYTNPEGLKFKYLLQPYNDKWNVVSGNQRMVEYTNVPYGKYTFSVLSSLDGENWSTKEAIYKFTILPFWHQTIWARLLFGLLGILFIYGVYRWRIHVETSNKLRLKKIISTRTSEVEHQKEELKAQRDDLHGSLMQLKDAEDKISTQNTELSEVNVKLEKTVEQRTADLKMVVNQLMSTNAELDQFVYRSAHDLRGPVARLIGICNLANKDQEYFKSATFMNNLEATAFEMDALIKRLIRINSLKNTKLTIAPIDFRNEIESIIETQTSEIDGLSVRTHVAPFLYHSDSTLLRVLIDNVINNAVSYQDAKKEDRFINVKVKLLPSKDNFEIVVEDNGIGIDDDIKDYLFTMFYKGVNRKNGFGLGLYEVQLIVKRLGGEVTLDHHDGLTTFRCVLPLSIEKSLDKIIEKQIQTS